MTRRGMTLIELAVAGGLGHAAGGLPAVAYGHRRHADSVEQRQLATIEVGNVLERVAARRGPN